MCSSILPDDDCVKSPSSTVITTNTAFSDLGEDALQHQHRIGPTPELCTTNELVETVDDFVAVQSLLVQQRSTSLNTQPVFH